VPFQFGANSAVFVVVTFSIKTGFSLILQLTNVGWMTILSFVPKFNGSGAMPLARVVVSKNK
jgi:hypothetical protein